MPLYLDTVAREFEDWLDDWYGDIMIGEKLYPASRILRDDNREYDRMFGEYVWDRYDSYRHEEEVMFTRKEYDSEEEGNDDE